MSDKERLDELCNQFKRKLDSVNSYKEPTFMEKKGQTLYIANRFKYKNKDAE